MITQTPDYWQAATSHLSKSCPVMKRLIARHKGEGLRARGDAFYTLVRSVVGQQISVKAADAVWAKVAALVSPLTPQMLLALSDDKLRACGLSAQKVAYAKNVAQFFVERGIGIGTSPSPEIAQGRFRPLPVGEVPKPRVQGVNPSAALPLPSGEVKKRTSRFLGEGDYWSNLSDEEIIVQLTSIKGIGTWTAEMFLIFHLMRPDVFPVKDLGLLKAINLHLVEPKKIAKTKWLKPKEYQAISKRWAPYRTVATWYLWRALDPVPVAY